MLRLNFQQSSDAPRIAEARPEIAMRVLPIVPLLREPRESWSYFAVALSAAMPAITDRLETGSWPGSIRELITEVVCGALILALGILAIRGVRKDRDAFREVVLELDRVASSDALTGIGNRRAFEIALNQLSRSGRREWILLADLDRLKSVNDALGHAAGDAVLRRAADILTAGPGRCFRIGGDEFVKIFDGQSDLVAREEAVRLVASIAREEAGVGFSAGLARHNPHESGWEAVARADEALYGAKRSGGGCYRLSPADPAPR